MWFFTRKPNAKKEQLRALKEANFNTIDKVTESLDKGNKKLDDLNKELEARGDTAFKIYVGTGARRRQKS